MNTFVLDTNIVLAYFQNNEKIITEIESLFPLFTDENFTVISIVTVGELYSLALQRQWGKMKIIKLIELLKEFVIVDINADDIIERYATIDAYSQGKLKQNALPPEMSSRNMGKNDLWIAATAATTKSTLITTDEDFMHLKDTYLSVFYISLSRLFPKTK